MIPEKMLEVLNYEGVISIVTQGPDGPHVANTWNSYIIIKANERLLIPAGRMNKTENNIKGDSRVLLTLGSREVEGFHSMGTGFLITGTGEFMHNGGEYDEVKKRFPWIRAALVITPASITQTL
ncbi:MAG: pyridoxamine 5'-phosphate oxidase family protein [Clostridiales bacterium]|nr:pyridoxamine 5'-phosphate oxidase family protein [Clostridiales bacterium]